MSEMPEAAVEAATMSIQCDDELPCGEWTSRGVAERALDQAYPHIRRAVIEELVGKYEAECYRCGPLSQDRWDRTGAIRLLRAELEGDEGQS